MRKYSGKVLGAVLAALLATSLPIASALALTSHYKQDEARHPAATKFTPKRFGYMPSQRYLPGTSKVKKKCIPNGQARCIARPDRPNPFASRSNGYNSLPPTRSGSTASPVVKTFNFDEYVEGYYAE